MKKDNKIKGLEFIIMVAIGFFLTVCGASVVVALLENIVR